MSGPEPRFAYGLLDFSSPFSPEQGGGYYLEKVFPRLSFLEIFLDRAMRIKGIDRYIAVVHESLAKEIPPYLSRWPFVKVVILPAGIQAFYQAHERLVMGRKWSHQSIRGGLLDATVYDEIVPMEIIKQLSGQIKASALVHLHPGFPLLIPEYAEQALLVAQNKDGKTRMPMTIRQSMLGLCPAVISEYGLADLERRNWLPLHVFRSNSLHDGLTSMRLQVTHNMSEDVQRGRFFLRSRRDADRLRRLLAKLGEKELDWTVASFSRVLNECPEICLEDSPRELDLDVTSAPYPEACRMPRLATMPDMPPELLEKIYSQACEEEDCLLSIGEYGNLLEYPHLEKLRELIVARKPYGLQLVFDAETLLRKPEMFLSFFAMPLDIISIRLTSLCYSKEFSLDDFGLFLEDIAKRQLQLKGVPHLHLQLHKFEDIWRSYHKVHELAQKHMVDCNWVPYNDHACQMPPHRETLAFVPIKRYPCEKLLYQIFVQPDGSVSLCKTDFKRTHPIGNLNEKSVRGIWNDPRLLEFRRQQVLGIYEPELCSRCRNWMHT